MKKGIFTFICSIAFVFIIVTWAFPQEAANKTAATTDAKNKWANTVWKKVNNVAKEKRSFQVEKATTVAGVRGSEAEDRLLKQLYYRGGGKYPNRLELKNAIEILQSSILASPTDPSVPESKFFIAQCHEQLGDTESAIDTYRDIVKYHPDSEYAKNAKTELARLQAAK